MKIILSFVVLCLIEFVASRFYEKSSGRKKNFLFLLMSCVLVFMLFHLVFLFAMLFENVYSVESSSLTTDGVLDGLAQISAFVGATYLAMVSLQYDNERRIKDDRLHQKDLAIQYRPNIKVSKTPMFGEDEYNVSDKEYSPKQPITLFFNNDGRGELMNFDIIIKDEPVVIQTSKFMSTNSTLCRQIKLNNFSDYPMHRMYKNTKELVIYSFYEDCFGEYAIITKSLVLVDDNNNKRKVRDVFNQVYVEEKEEGKTSKQQFVERLHEIPFI